MRVIESCVLIDNIRYVPVKKLICDNNVVGSLVYS